MYYRHAILVFILVLFVCGRRGGATLSACPDSKWLTQPWVLPSIHEVTPRVGLCGPARILANIKYQLIANAWIVENDGITTTVFFPCSSLNSRMD
jgi:hypothetical protein